MSYHIAIVGSKEETMGFAALGVKAFSAKTGEEAKNVLFSLKKQTAEDEKYAVILVIEDLIKEISAEDYTKLSSGALPAIIPLPGNRGSSGFGNEKIRRIVEKAVGSDIFGDK